MPQSDAHCHLVHKGQQQLPLPPHDLPLCSTADSKTSIHSLQNFSHQSLQSYVPTYAVHVHGSMARVLPLRPVQSACAAQAFSLRGTPQSPRASSTSTASLAPARTSTWTWSCTTTGNASCALRPCGPPQTALHAVRNVCLHRVTSMLCWPLSQAERSASCHQQVVVLM